MSAIDRSYVIVNAQTAGDTFLSLCEMDSKCTAYFGYKGVKLTFRQTVAQMEFCGFMFLCLCVCVFFFFVPFAFVCKRC